MTPTATKAAVTASVTTPDTLPAPSGRVVYFDLLNICAAICVIGLHCNGLAHNFRDTMAWYQALAVEVLAYWAVPVFFMLSGATLMNYRQKYTTADFFKRRLLRTTIPFVAWSLFSAVYRGFDLTSGGVPGLLTGLLQYRYESVYWFFLPLFAVYLAMPVLSLLKDRKKLLWYMVIAAFLLKSLLPHLCRYLNITWNGDLAMPTMGGYLIFVVLGYLLSDVTLTRAQRMGVYALGAFGAGLRYVATALLSRADGATNRLFFSYTAYFSVFLAVAVFVWFRHLPLNRRIEASPRLCRLFQTLSSCSLGIYLMHMFIYRALKLFLSSDTWAWRLLVPFLIYAIALTATWIMKKIPLVRRLVP